MTTFTCPFCGTFNVTESTERLCQNCGAILDEDASGQPAPRMEATDQSEHLAEFDPNDMDSSTPHPESTGSPRADIRLSRHGESMAVLALLLPVAAQALILACNSEVLGIAIVLSYGAIFVTAVLLAVDASLLGTIDRWGVRRGGPVALFFGMLLLWIVCYPVAFFRRRHFGRPNYGPLALLVVGFFVAVPIFGDFVRFGVVQGVPTCDSREVVGMVDSLIRSSDIGPSVQSISGHRQTRYDSTTQTRTGQCRVKTRTRTITVTYSVMWIDRKAGTFQVEVHPFFP